MTVWVVYNEWNRGYDLEGSVDDVQVFATKDAAEDERRARIATFSDPEGEFYHPVYGEEEPEGVEGWEDWHVDIHIDTCEVQE